MFTLDLIPEFDGIRRQDTHHGRVLVFANGNIALEPNSALFARTEIRAIDALAVRYGLVPGCSPEPHGIFCYRSTLCTPKQWERNMGRQYSGALVSVSRGGTRVPRTAEQLAQLKEFIEAFAEDRLECLLNGQERALVARMKKVEERKAARDARYAVTSRAYGIFSVTRTLREFEVFAGRRLTEAEYRSLTKTVGGRWDREAKRFRVPLRNEIKLGRFLSRDIKPRKRRAGLAPKEQSSLFSQELARKEAQEKEAWARGERRWRVFAEYNGEGLRYRVGLPFMSNDGMMLVPTEITRGRHEDDPSSFGAPMLDDAYEFFITTRRATEQEVNARAAHIQQARDLKEAIDFVRDLAKTVEAEQDRPVQSSDPEGLVLFDGFNTYGGGTRFILEADGETLWHIHNNSADGDAWAAGNIGSSIAYRARISAAVRDRLLDLAEKYPMLDVMRPASNVFGANLYERLTFSPRNEPDDVREFRRRLMAREPAQAEPQG